MSVQIKTRDATTGSTKVVVGVVTSAGAASASKIPVTGANGTLDNTLLNTATGSGLVADAAKIIVTGTDGKFLKPHFRHLWAQEPKRMYRLRL